VTRQSAAPEALRRPDPQLGVFETMLVVDGLAVDLDAHRERLERSVRALFGEAPPEDAERLVREEAALLALGRVRIAVAPGATGALRAEVRSAAVDRDVVFPSWEGAARLAPLTVPGGIGEHKWVDRELLDAADRSSGAVSLVVDVDDTVLEASRANVFAVLGGSVVTPELDGRILPGVARRRVLDVLRNEGVRCEERPLGLGELLAADEVFLTGSIRGVEPVVSCGERTWTEGLLRARAARALARRWGIAETAAA
jgi:para-aminobenzoate synthetase/4-amino-4-deoxychorismate lyase